PTSNKIVWKWSKGENLGNSDAGKPATGDTRYAFCLYDADETLLYSATVPAGANWVEKGLRYTYKDKEQSREGIKSIKIALGGPGKAKASMVASNKLGTLTTLIPPPYGALPLRAQLVNDRDTCLEAVYAVPSRNQEGKLTATGQ
ncbi:MAG TPA: hypothetical protein VEB21_06285, partial [Terriglobales bacterium]|nr:hypothetical protein [Terriglobales bacterium]